MNQFISPLSSNTVWFHPVTLEEGEKICLKENPSGEKKFRAHFNHKVVDIELRTYDPIKKTIQGTYAVENTQGKIIFRLFTDKTDETRLFYTGQPKGIYNRYKWGLSFLKV